MCRQRNSFGGFNIVLQTEAVKQTLYCNVVLYKTSTLFMLQICKAYVLHHTSRIVAVRFMVSP